MGATTGTLKSVWLLSVLAFVVGYTFELLNLNDLYPSQRFLLLILQLVLTLWAMLEVVGLRRRETSIPLNALFVAAIAQLLIAALRLPADAPPATVFVPLNAVMLLIISKLLVDAFSFTERQRTAMLQREVETRMKAEQELQRLATTDHLTGAWNRNHLTEALSTEIERSRRYDSPVSMVIVDVDHFKAINDDHGHLAGDAVLIELTRRVRANLRSVDVFARLGGEEFVAVLPDCGLAEAEVVAEKLRALVADEPFPTAGAVTASFGVAQLDSAETSDDWLRRADHALYAAKRGGRNRVCSAVTSPA